MKHLQKSAFVFALFFYIFSSLFPPISFACHGNMRWRFMPIEQARKEYARLEAELKKQRLLITEEYLPVELQKWIKYYDNPVFKHGPEGSWESKSVDCFSIGIYSGQYMMWYVGTPGTLNCQIGLATSPDGIHWTKHPDNPVLRLGEMGTWEESILICQSVMYDKEERLFKMWYIGGNTVGILAIGLATSPDGIRWTKYAGNPVIRVTEPWEGTVLEAFSVLKDRDGYHIWFGGNDLNEDKASIGYAASPDGIHWTKYPGNPIFTPDPPKTWDSYSVSDPEIIYFDGLYHMWYKGWKRHGGNAWIGHATSLDGINWERDPENPVLMTSALPGSWETFEVYRPRLILGKENRFGPNIVIDRMWYSGRTYTLRAQIGLASQIRRTENERRIKRRFPRVTQDQMELAVEAASSGSFAIEYFTPWLGKIQLNIFSGSGEKVKTLVQEWQMPGYYQVTWDGCDENNKPVDKGLYYCELRGDNYLMTKEIVIEK